MLAAASTAAVEVVGAGLAVGLELVPELVPELVLVHDAVRVMDCWLLSILSAKSNKPLLYQANNPT